MTKLDIPLEVNGGWPVWLTGAGLGFCSSMGLAIFKVIVPTTCSRQYFTHGPLGWPCIGTFIAGGLFVFAAFGFLAVLLHHSFRP